MKSVAVSLLLASVLVTGAVAQAAPKAGGPAKIAVAGGGATTLLPLMLLPLAFLAAGGVGGSPSSRSSN